MDGSVTILGLDENNNLRPVQVDASGRIIVSASGGGVAMSLIDDKLLIEDAAEVVFADIPDIFKHLKLVYHGRSSRSSTYATLNVQFNDDGGNNYHGLGTYLYHDAQLLTGNRIGTTSGYVGEVTGATAGAYYAGSGYIEIPNYISSYFYKVVYGQTAFCNTGEAGAVETNLFTTIWKSLAAISKMRIFCESSGNILEGSRFTLYGIN